MTKFRHGFKAQCERRSIELRSRLGLEPTSALRADILAQDFGTTVWSLSDIDGLSEDDARQLTVTEGDSWSAFTLGIQGNHLIVYNPSASQPRINSVCMHELSHIILGHELVDAGVSVDGHLLPGHYDKTEEAEADWLAGALLLPRPAVLAIRKQGLSNDAVREEYMVSREMLNWRIRMTGVDHQLRHARRKRAG